jgi:Arc/MetJ-type ribon-helix-helix transcriptional regulator
MGIRKGRERMGAEKSVALPVRVPGEWLRALREMSDKGNSVSDLVRSAVRRFLVQNGKLG